jgi:hypothetical protein
MRDENVRRDYYWIVEAVDRKGRVIFNGEFTNFEQAWNKYDSFKEGKMRSSVTLQRKFREYKIA